MKKLVLVLIFLALIAAGVFGYLKTYGVTLRFSEAQLLEKLAHRVPVTKRYLLIFEVVMDDPAVRLVDGDERVYASLDVTLNIDLGFNSHTYEGELAVSSGVRYDATQGEVFLTDAKIERFQLEGLPNKYADKVKSSLTVAMTTYYNERPIYSLDQSKFKHLAAKLVLQDISVEDKQLKVHLGL